MLGYTILAFLSATIRVYNFGLSECNSVRVYNFGLSECNRVRKAPLWKGFFIKESKQVVTKVVAECENGGNLKVYTYTIM